MRNNLFGTVLASLLLFGMGASTVAKDVPCESELYRSLSESFKQGDSIERIVNYLAGKNVKYVLSDENLRTLQYRDGNRFPTKFTLGINNPLRRTKLITTSEIIVLNFVNQRFESLTCKLIATGP